MKLKFTFLITALLLLGNLTTWGQTSTYTKITSRDDLTNGDYLIVYEGESFIFDGSLGTLDASNNYQSVTIVNNSISTSDNYNFTIASITGGYSIQSASGWYIGNTSNSNSLQSSKTMVYLNTISFGSGNADIISSSGAYLRFNTTSGQDRFRYYKSGSYSAQKPVCLYKKVASGPTPLTAPTLTGQQGIGSIDYSWSSIDNADSYRLYYTSESVTSIDTTITETTSVTRVIISGSSTSYPLTELTPGTSYSAVLVAVPSPTSTSYTRSAASDMVTNTPVSSIQLSAPADFSGEAGDQQITFSWTAVEHASGYKISYTYEGGDETIIVIDDGTATTYTLTGLTNGTSYSCKIMAVGDETNYISSSYSDTINVTPNLPSTEAPTITVNGVSTGTTNEYYVTAQVTINAVEGATIYYTTDGNDPTTTSTQYSAPFDVTATTTVKAIAVEDGHSNSSVTSQTITIVQPAEATFTDGVYSETFATNLGDWKNITNNTGVNWAKGTLNSSSCATINGYQKDSEVWLVSPKMAFPNNKMVVNFESSAKYSGPDLELYYSTSYNGYGEIVAEQWTKITTANIASGTTWISSGDVELNGTIVYVAFKYTSTASSARAYGIKEFQAKQCYTLTYDVNGGSGEMADANSPYAVGSTVTVLENGFTAPASQAFVKWNTSADGTGTDDYFPGNDFTMPAANTTLYAIWGAGCTVSPIVDDVAGEATYSAVSNNPQYNIDLLSDISNIGGCDVYDYGFVYSTTNENPEIEGADVTKSPVGTSWEETSSFEYTIEDVVESTTYYVRSYATNNAGTSYSNVEQVVVDAYPTYTITYNNNGVVSETTQNVYQQCSTTLLSPTTTPDGFTFAGWSTSTVDVTNTVPTTMVETEYTPTANVTLYAVYAISNVSGNYTWGLVTDVTKLAAGNQFMLYGQKSDGTTNKVAGSLTSSYLTAIDVSAPVNNQISQPDGAEIFTLAAGQDGKWVFVSHDGKYLRTGVSYSETSGTEWTITIDSEDGDATISVDSYSLQFNSSSPRFKSYDSNQSYTALYRYTQESALMNYSTNITALSGTLTTQTYNTNCYISGPTTIPTGVTVTCNYGLGNTNAANLIIEDGGQLIINNSGVMATVEKEIGAWTTSPVGGWYTIASPVANQTIDGSFTPSETNGDYDMYRYDEATAQWFNQKDTENQFAHSTFQVGTGYLVAYEQGGTKQFVGELNTSASVYLTSTVGELQGFNLIANPYTHNIYKGAGAAIDHANLNDGFYVMNNHGSWVVSNYQVAIAPCQSVLVKATSAIENFAIVKKTDAATGERSSKARSAEGFIQIEVSNETYMDRAFVNFGQGSGLSKIHHLNVSAPMLYIPQDGKDYAIAVMSSAKENLQELPVCFTTGERGSYTIFAKPQNLEFTYLHLIDNLTGADINLLEQNSYTFVAGTNDYASRFKLVFNPIENGSTVGENFAFFNNGNLVINGIEEGATLQLIDVQGRILSSEILSGSYNQSLNVKSGVYVVRLIEGSKVRIQKLVVE